MGVPDFVPVLADTVERTKVRAANPPGLFSPGCDRHLVLRCASRGQPPKGLAVKAVIELARPEDHPNRHLRKG